MIRIIGIDPGSRKTGIGVIDYDPARRTTELIHAKVLRLNLETGLSDRLGELASKLQEVLENYQPHQAVLEDVFTGEHARSALILGQARGAALAILSLAKIPVTHLAPRKVKQAITGIGHADKSQVGQMVQALLKLDKKPAEDAADALAVALSFVLSPEQSHAQKRSSKKQKNQALYELAKSQGLV